MGSIAYKYNRFDPGIFMELYLPKKAEYQGILYDTLTGGFLIDDVRSHLKSKWTEICQLMSGRYTSKISSLDQLDKILSVFYGYSMYEVDGVFFNHNTKGVVEERTQVIRLMFRFDINDVVQSGGSEGSEIEHRIAKAVADDYLSCLTDKPAFLGLNSGTYRQRWPAHTSFIEKLVSHLEQWEFSMVMFILGYVTFKLCEQIKFLHQTTSRSPEEEIWITSFWNLRINRIIKDDRNV